jgi:hypothetical protein
VTTPTAVPLVPAGPAPRLPARQAGGFSLLIRKKRGGGFFEVAGNDGLWSLAGCAAGFAACPGACGSRRVGREQTPTGPRADGSRMNPLAAAALSISFFVHIQIVSQSMCAGPDTFGLGNLERLIDTSVLRAPCARVEPYHKTFL